MVDVTPTSGTPAPAPAAAPAAPATLAQQVMDSQVAPAAPAAPAAAPADKPTSDATPAPVPAPADSTDAQAKLAEAEKRLKDTQAWGHRNAEEAAKLKTELTKLQNHPVIGKLLDVMSQPQGQLDNPQAAAEQAEMQAAWKDYQSSKSDEEAFAKILQFAETRGARRALTEVQRAQGQAQAAARVQQRNQLTVQAINKTVTESAPDIPLQLFWAMSGQAESECPATITDYAERLQWQVGRAVDLSRGVLAPRVNQAAQSAAVQANMQSQAGTIMSGGGVAPQVAQPGAAPKPKTMADYIKDMQRTQMGQK